MKQNCLFSVTSPVAAAVRRERTMRTETQAAQENLLYDPRTLVFQNVPRHVPDGSRVCYVTEAAAVGKK